MGFRFRQFELEDQKSTMRVGTDSMLLGAWADPTGAVRILDIGTGCGVLALMMAQKSTAMITAVDIDRESVTEATENAERSPWNDRISLIMEDIILFASKSANTYDFIISNPPFFNHALKSGKDRKNSTRHDTTLSLGQLFRTIDILLTPDGRFWTILPADLLQLVEKEGLLNNLILTKKTFVYSRPGIAPKRILLEISRNSESDPRWSEIYILDNSGQFSVDYLALTQEFHQF